MQTTQTDPNAQAAALGEQLMHLYLAALSDHTDRPARRAATRYLVDQYRLWVKAPATGRNSVNGDVILMDAVTDVLHYADGWELPEAVLTRAFGIHWHLTNPDRNGGTGPAPELPTSASDPHDLSALGGLISELMDLAATAHSTTVEDLANAAETRFWDEAQEARMQAVRALREANQA